MQSFHAESHISSLIGTLQVDNQTEVYFFSITAQVNFLIVWKETMRPRNIGQAKYYDKEQFKKVIQSTQRKSCEWKYNN